MTRTSTNQKMDIRSKAQSNCISSTGSRTQVTISGSLCSEDYSAGLEIAADNITLDCAGKIIDGKGKAGETGININSKSNITLKNCKVKGFFIGVGASGGSNIIIENGDFSGNSIGSPVSISSGTEGSPVENLSGQNQDTGAGIQFDGVSESKIINSTSKNSVAGVILNNSSNVQILGGNYSNNSGWGIKLKSSSNNIISNVVANGNDRWCVNDGIIHRGCESAAVLLIDGSNNNSILNNQLNDSGDGFYINGDGHVPSNNNTIAYNTANNAVNGNSIETTFSSGNKFIGNKVAGSNYGLWLGYSEHSYVINNIAGAKAGAINIDHSSCNIVVNNKLDSGEPENNKIGSDSGGCHDNMVTGNTPEIPIQNCENTGSLPVCGMEYPISLPQAPEKPTPPPIPTAPPQPTAIYQQPITNTPYPTPTSFSPLPAYHPIIIAPIINPLPTTIFPQPTTDLPAQAGYQPPTKIIPVPSRIIINPTATPTPTSIPTMQIISDQINTAVKSWSEKIRQFMQTILP